MKTKLLLMVMGLILVMFCYTSAQVPQMINYQGKLTKSTGAPLDTTIQMVFTIYADSNGTIPKWSETQISVKVEKGVLNVLLGCVNAIPDSVFDGTIRYLGVKVGGDPEITPRKSMVSVAYAYRSGSATPGDFSVSQAKLKSTTGEVSFTSSGSIIDNWADLILPGGEYGFYAQTKMNNTNNAIWSAHIDGDGTSGNDYWRNGWTSYRTNITLAAEGNGNTIYAQQRYITSSGKDHWIFFLLDKETKRIIGSYQAPDHPCHGQGGDENDIPHPFGSYDSAKCEVILIDNEILTELRSKVTSKRSLLTVINEDYEIDFKSHPVYKPREIIEIDEYGDKKGEIIKKIETPEWAKILIGKDEIYLKQRLVKTLPSYISYKKLKAKSSAIAQDLVLSQSTGNGVHRHFLVK